MAEDNIGTSTERSLFVDIVANLTFGGGFTLHTEYQLQVRFGDQTWLIYRRYAHFETLHKNIMKKYNEEELLEKKIIFPEKVYLGSILSTYKSVIEQRRAGLQIYLQIIFSIDELNEEEYVQEFIDMKNKGVSGIHRQLGADKILKETFCRVKIIKQFFGIWQLCYVVVLRDGAVYVLQSVYDDTNSALMSWALVAVGVQIIPRSRDNSIVISCTTHQQRLILSFPTPLESASWMRALTDFATQTSFQQTIAYEDATKPKPAVTQNNAAMKRSSPPPTFSSPLQQAPVKHVYAAGTGNTTDELSAMYGI